MAFASDAAASAIAAAAEGEGDGAGDDGGACFGASASSSAAAPLPPAENAADAALAALGAANARGPERPTHFVAVRLVAPEIRRRVEELQQWFIAREPLLEACAVPPHRLHSALLVTAIPPQRIHDAERACAEAGAQCRELLAGVPLRLVVGGVGHFGRRVLYTGVRSEPPDMLEAFHRILCHSFMRHGLPVMAERGWLAPGEQPRRFFAHASLLKVSKGMAHCQRKTRRALRSVSFTDALLAVWRGEEFGSQPCCSFDLVAMVGSSRDGYYPRLHVESLEALPPCDDAAGGSAASSSVAGAKARGHDSSKVRRTSAPESAAGAENKAPRVRILEALGLFVWPSVSVCLGLRDLLRLAAASPGGLSVLRASVRGVRLALLSSSAGRNSPRLGGRDIRRPLAELRGVGSFMRQAAKAEVQAEIHFSETVQEELLARGLDELRATVRRILPAALGPDFGVRVDAVQHVRGASAGLLSTICAAQPRVMGLEALSEADLEQWTSTCLNALAGLDVLVHSWLPLPRRRPPQRGGAATAAARPTADSDVDSASCFAQLLLSLPEGIRGLDFQNLAGSLRDFPVTLLPSTCTAFGTIVLQRDTSSGDYRGSMAFTDFEELFPVFPRHVALVRASLGTDGRWVRSAEGIADVFRAKFPGLQVLQLELWMRASATTTDVPFVAMAYALLAAGIRVEVTNISCRPAQYEFLRAALDHAGALVRQVEDGRPSAHPFSHPRYAWPAEELTTGDGSSDVIVPS
eukprot:TRINITY_DN56405_c0_g1_i1.p1 TRINITY_DN56405_c0_g1~~TRINITY_DN56405_c0_g1_i1.p1  ORF type:complete len:750 (-),score=158.35 TRINITY_DN56405_c0_g1_i1:65-2314(-)